MMSSLLVLIWPKNTTTVYDVVDMASQLNGPIIPSFIPLTEEGFLEETRKLDAVSSGTNLLSRRLCFVTQK